MSTSIDALKEAVNFEKKALEQYQIAIDHAVHAETKQELEKYAADKAQKIDTLSWMIMAESGKLEKSEEAAQPAEAPKATGGKCPFSGELAKMGIDLSKLQSPHS